MAAEFISAVAVNWAAGIDPAGQSVTVPADATAAYMTWAYDGVDANGHGLASVTLAGNAPDQTFEIPTGAGFFPATGVAVWYNPPTGSQTLDPAWDIAPVEGPTCIVAFTKGGDTSSWRDVDADQDIDVNAVSVTLTTESGDLVIKLDQRFDGSENPPSLTSGWTNGATGGNADEGCRLSYIVATGTTEVCASEDESYSTVVAFSIPAAASGPFDVEPTSPVSVAGRVAVAGDIEFRIPWFLEAPLQLEMAGVLGVSGDIGIEKAVDLVPSSPVALTGMLAAAGDIEISQEPRLNLTPASPIVLAGHVAVSGDIEVTQASAMDLVPTSPITLAGQVAAAGDVGFRAPWEFENPLQVTTMSGRMAVFGDIEFATTFDLVPTSPVSLVGALTASGDIGLVTTFDVAPTSPVSLVGVLTASGDIGLVTTFDVAPTTTVALGGLLALSGDVAVVQVNPFDVATTSPVALTGRLAVTGDVFAGSPFDVAPSSPVGLSGALAVVGDVTAGSTPPAPPPPPAVDPLDPKYLGKRKRPNVKMRWHQEPGEPPTAPLPPAEPPPAESPRLARGLDLDLLPEFPATSVPAPKPTAPKAPPSAAPAPKPKPEPASAPVPVAPPDFSPVLQAVATLQEAQAALPQHVAQLVSQLQTTLLQQVEQLAGELRAARAEVTTLKTKIERDARNRRRAEEIARRLLDE